MQFLRRKITEDAPTNNAGSGNVAGIGVGPKGEPGIHPKDQPKKNRSPNPKVILQAMLRRKPPKAIVESCRVADFGGSACFSVSPSLFYEIKMHKRKGKHWRTYLNEDDCYREIREYANKHPKGKIAVQNETTGEMVYVRYC